MRYWFEEPYEAFVELSDLYDKHIHDQSERRLSLNALAKRPDWWNWLKSTMCTAALSFRLLSRLIIRVKAWPPRREARDGLRFYGAQPL